MATFGKQFLQQMAQPSFGKGLFTAAQQIGAAPIQRKQLEAYRNMTPQQQIAYDKANASIPEAVASPN